MTVEQAAELLKISPQYIHTLVARSDDLNMVGNTIIAKRDKINTWLVGGCVALFFAISGMPGMLGMTG
ncbi:helix-turn-helix domain-containing protein [Bacillus sp. YC2]|uniref:helix-turn-helix domain-containing protein n=1 Tax=Bacillus sp. YC2 TaxID=2861287 RepID=UPI001CA7A457|nr:helix-turn-helix domain-containing protein [Bacillus sp. YC2]MBY8914846.1 helix-turn-helix domain-containing protein [Bacillus sp. YC2]